MVQRNKGLDLRIRPIGSRKAGEFTLSDSRSYDIDFSGSGSGPVPPDPPDPELNPLNVSSSNGKGCYVWYRPDFQNIQFSGGSQTVVLAFSASASSVAPFRQLTENFMPTWVPSGSMNSKPALAFNGTNTRMALTDNWSIPGDQATVFIVHEPHSSSYGQGASSVLLEPSLGQAVVAGISVYSDTTLSSAPHAAAAAGQGSGNRNLTLASASLYTKEFTESSGSIFCATFNRSLSASAEISMSVNFSPHPMSGCAIDSLSAGTTGLWASYVSSLGCRVFGGFASFYSGSIYEIIIYDHVLSSSEMMAVKNYLSGRYAPQINTFLPTNITGANSATSGKLAYWIRGDQVITTGSNVGVIKELTFGIDLTQSAAARQSLWNPNGGMKGRPGIFFNNTGTSGSYSNRTTHFSFSGSRDVTIFAVIEPSPSAVAGNVFHGIIEHNININTDNGFCLGLGTGNGTPPPKIVFWGQGGSNATSAWVTGSFANYAPMTAQKPGFILMARLEGKTTSAACLTSSAGGLNVDGKWLTGGYDNGIVSARGGNGGNNTALPSSKTYIGSRGGNSSFFSGTIYEILVFDYILQGSDHEAVWNYLSSRYY